MGFTKKISDDVLVACGRCCSICHKYCGTKIELHHIKQKADNDEDSFNNCIPLCFDCHADVKSYNPNHPKGKKFTEPELISHRDNWYLKVKSGSYGLIVNNDYKELDILTYRRVKELLWDSNSIEFADINNFAGFAFDRDRIKPFHEFENECNNPVFEFLDPDLELIKSNLSKHIKEFSSLIAINTFPCSGNNHYNTVPDEWEITQPERFKKVVDKIHTSTTNIVNVYNDLVHSARRKLGVN